MVGYTKDQYREYVRHAIAEVKQLPLGPVRSFINKVLQRSVDLEYPETTCVPLELATGTLVEAEVLSIRNDRKMQAPVVTNCQRTDNRANFSRGDSGWPGIDPNAVSSSPAVEGDAISADRLKDPVELWQNPEWRSWAKANDETAYVRGEIGTHLQTEREMHNAWRKRAVHAETELLALRIALPASSMQQATGKKLCEIDLRFDPAETAPASRGVTVHCRNALPGMEDISCCVPGCQYTRLGNFKRSICPGCFAAGWRTCGECKGVRGKIECLACEDLGVVPTHVKPHVSELPEPVKVETICGCGHTLSVHDGFRKCMIPGCYCPAFNQAIAAEPAKVIEAILDADEVRTARDAEWRNALTLYTDRDYGMSGLAPGDPGGVPGYLKAMRAIILARVVDELVKRLSAGIAWE